MPNRLFVFSRLFFKVPTMVDKGSQPPVLAYYANKMKHCNTHLLFTFCAPEGIFPQQRGRAPLPPPPPPPHPTSTSTSTHPARPAYGWPGGSARAARCPPTGCWRPRTRWSSARSQTPPAWLPEDASTREDAGQIWVDWILQHLNWRLSSNLLK